MLERTLTHHELECLDMHEKLAFIVICSAGVDSSVADFRLERIRVPQFDRVYRLDAFLLWRDENHKINT